MLSGSRIPVLAKAIFGLVAIVLLISFFPFAKLIIYNPIARPILLKLYATPNYEKVLTEYSITDIEFSKKSPFSIFQYHLGDAQYRNARGTGLFNLETKETVILTPKNPQPNNSSIFSPNGVEVLFAVVDEQKAEYLTNENGTWRTIKSYDLYAYDTKSGTNTKLSQDIFPLIAPDDAYDPYLFGWVDKDNIYYYCPGNYIYGVGRRLAYCFLDIHSRKLQQKSYTIGNERSVLSNIYIDRAKSVQLENGPKDSSSFDKTAVMYGECTLGGYDGCEMITLWVKNGSKKIFLANKANLLFAPYVKFNWSFNNHIYITSNNPFAGQPPHGMVKIY